MLLFGSIFHFILFLLPPLLFKVLPLYLLTHFQSRFLLSLLHSFILLFKFINSRLPNLHLSHLQQMLVTLLYSNHILFGFTFFKHMVFFLNLISVIFLQCQSFLVVLVNSYLNHNHTRRPCLPSLASGYGRWTCSVRKSHTWDLVSLPLVKHQLTVNGSLIRSCQFCFGHYISLTLD